MEPKEIKSEVVVKAVASLQDEISEELKKEDKAISEILDETLPQ